MEILLLGTSAAEAWPSPFCNCEGCEKARRYKGRNIRTRSNALIDNVVKVDYGPDTVMQMQREGKNLIDIETLVFTHDHDDHFCPDELQYRNKGFVGAGTPLKTLHVYGNSKVMNRLHQMYPDDAEFRMVFHEPLQPFTTVTSPDGTTIYPFPASHSEEALVLKITRGGRSLFYGHDSGEYPEETIKALSGSSLDIVLFDFTYSINEQDNNFHMGLNGILNMREAFRNVGAIGDHTKVVATHISHHGLASYDELAWILMPQGIDLAYDGVVYNTDK